MRFQGRHDGADGEAHRRSGGGRAAGRWELVGESRTIRALRELARQVALSDTAVLIGGETGTGKEVVARLIHEHSPRASRPFVAINCAALPESLVESELFGHEKGAFTGAFSSHRGCFEEAHTGTVFLDEVTEIRPHVQVKLLRVLQEKEIRRVGGNRPVRVDVRIVAASNRELQAALADGSLREDFYYRLNVVEMHLPPLRERREDIAALCRHFLRRHAASSPLRDVGASALHLLELHDWPGNVRELENAVARAAALALPDDGELILPRHLPARIRGDASDRPGDDATLDLRAALSRVKRIYVEEALRRTDGNKAEAARLLGISRRGFYNALEGSDAAVE